MATRRTMQSGDTWPPMKGLASDADGPVDLVIADSLRLLCKSTSHLIELPVTVIDPIEQVGNESFNWQADFEDGDTDVIGVYVCQLEVTWDSDQIETFPNSRAGAPVLVIEQANE